MVSETTALLEGACREVGPDVGGGEAVFECDLARGRASSDGSLMMGGEPGLERHLLEMEMVTKGLLLFVMDMPAAMLDAACRKLAPSGGPALSRTSQGFGPAQGHVPSFSQ